MTCKVSDHIFAHTQHHAACFAVGVCVQSHGRICSDTDVHYQITSWRGYDSCKWPSAKKATYHQQPQIAGYHATWISGYCHQTNNESTRSGQPIGPVVIWRVRFLTLLTLNDICHGKLMQWLGSERYFTRFISWFGLGSIITSTIKHWHVIAHPCISLNGG